jgi:hypothetical protein
MSYFEQALNSLKYGIHTLTYNPDAEKYVKEQERENENVKQAAEREKQKAATTLLKSAEEQKKAAERAEKERIAAERAEFSFRRLLGRIFKYFMIAVGIALLIGSALYGASLATNLNVYKSAPFRVIYAIWGFLFFWVVIPYVWLYRRLWLHKTPEFYAILPLVPYKFDHWFMQKFFDWITFNPVHIDELKEWN